MTRSHHRIVYWTILCILCVGATTVEAATMRLNPNTGVYSVGAPFSVNVVLNTENKPVNAADGQITFNPKELQVVSVSRASSIFNLWTQEPTFSNAQGTISFGGGSPSGYTGTTGTILNISFKALGAGAPKVTFKSGSILAADGLGTNILTSMNGGSYTINSLKENPEPEYIAPAHTPKAPMVTSSSHSDQTLWYKEKTAKLSWTLPNDVTAIRTLLDATAGSIPTIVYDELITTKTIEDLDEGVSYFHIQFKNKDGWGKITHYRLAVDTKSPDPFSIGLAQSTTSPRQILQFTVEDTSPIVEYRIQIDGGELFVYKDEESDKQYTPPVLPPGRHTFIVEAVDSAGNSTATTYALTVDAFEKPVFTDYPTRVNTDVIPAIKGKTKPNAVIDVRVRRALDGMLISTVNGSDGTEPFSIPSNDQGEFTYVPDAAFERGVYVVTAVAMDEYGRMSEESDEIKIIVEAPGYVVLGTMVVNALSVIVPLSALVLLMIFGMWYLWHKLVGWKKRVQKETTEAEESLAREFTQIVGNLDAKILALKESRKGKLTRAESELITQIEDDLKHARTKISKEIEDIEDVIT